MPAASCSLVDFGESNPRGLMCAGLCSCSAPADPYVLSAAPVPTRWWWWGCLSVIWQKRGVPTPSRGLQTLYSSQVMCSRTECGLLQLQIAGMVFEGRGIWGQTEHIWYKNDWVALNFVTACFSMCFLSSAWKEAVDCGCLCLHHFRVDFCTYAGPDNL